MPVNKVGARSKINTKLSVQHIDQKEVQSTIVKWCGVVWYGEV